jgi:hypothetical protein
VSIKRDFAGLGQVNILDIAIMENASGKRAMIPALHAGFERLTKAPADFAQSPESALVYTLFAWTFATANICKAVFAAPGAV